MKKVEAETGAKLNLNQKDRVTVMSRFFVRNDDINETIVYIRDKDAFHIARSLRMAVGESITVSDGACAEYTCELVSITDSLVTARIVEKMSSDKEPPYQAILYQALPKGDKLDTIIQKAVECGVSEIVPFESERCIMKVKADAENRKTERRCKIAEEAAKQCGRGIIPNVRQTCTFDYMLKSACKCDIKIFCYEGENGSTLKSYLQSIKNTLADKDLPKIAIIIGSEGGFSCSEVKKAREFGLMPVGLGKRILRTETASSFVLSCLSYEIEM